MPIKNVIIVYMRNFLREGLIFGLLEMKRKSRSDLSLFTEHQISEKKGVIGKKRLNISD